MKPTTVPTLVVPKNPVERRIFIKLQLELRGLSFAAIARQRGVARVTVSKTAAGAPSAPLQAALAEAIEMPVEVVFPERFDRNGRRVTPVRSRQDSRYASGAHGQSAEAA
ncbi:helix-turn-helix domain-containing protein [Ferrovibrio terrae]|uniref:helix-turn-helix domain-containing protein n=1 Tax=Ferrovibrio terrae TaxID=2594003 RepID=UPI0031380C07